MPSRLGCSHPSTTAPRQEPRLLSATGASGLCLAHSSAATHLLTQNSVGALLVGSACIGHARGQEALRLKDALSFILTPHGSSVMRPCWPVLSDGRCLRQTCFQGFSSSSSMSSSSSFRSCGDTDATKRSRTDLCCNKAAPWAESTLLSQTSERVGTASKT